MRAISCKSEPSVKIRRARETNSSSCRGAAAAGATFTRRAIGCSADVSSRSKRYFSPGWTRPCGARSSASLRPWLRCCCPAWPRCTTSGPTVQRPRSGQTFYTRTYIDGLPLDRAVITSSPAERLNSSPRSPRSSRRCTVPGSCMATSSPATPSSMRAGDAHVIDFGGSDHGSRIRRRSARRHVALHGPRKTGARPERSDREVPHVFALGVTLGFCDGQLPFGADGGQGQKSAAKAARPGVLRRRFEQGAPGGDAGISRAYSFYRLPTVPEFDRRVLTRRYPSSVASPRVGCSAPRRARGAGRAHRLSADAAPHAVPQPGLGALCS